MVCTSAHYAKGKDKDWLQALAAKRNVQSMLCMTIPYFISYVLITYRTREMHAADVY